MVKLTFACGHPYEPENEIKIGGGRIGCRQCRRAAKRDWRERAREIAEGKRPAMKRGPTPAAAVSREDMSDPAYGSRKLLEAYARYYERHVRSRAA